MKVVAVSDFHGWLPQIPPCDLLLIAGDICPVKDHRLPYQCWWLKYYFSAWLLQQPARKTYAVWGNHDLIGEHPGKVPELPCRVLTDEAVEFEGYNIYGIPWQRRFHDWAFNLDEPELSRKYEAIPPETDIIVSHGPPLGWGDWSTYSLEHCGSPTFRQHIIEHRPRLSVFGHFHSGHGLYNIIGDPETIIANVSHVSEKYHPTHDPMVFELPDR